MKVHQFLLIAVLAACSPNKQDSLESPQQPEPAPLEQPAVNSDNAGTEYWPNGVKKAEGNMKDGKRHGLWTGYNDKGMVKSRCEYVNGVTQGPTVVFHDNGAVYYSGDYKDGKQVGKWRFFDEQGKELKVVDFDAEQ